MRDKARKKSIAATVVVATLAVALALFMYFFSKDDSSPAPPAPVKKPGRQLAARLEEAPAPIAPKDEAKEVDPPEGFERFLTTFLEGDHDERNEAEEELLTKFDRYKMEILKNRDNKDPEVQARLSRVLDRKRNQFYDELLTPGLELKGTAMQGSKEWPFVLSMNKHEEDGKWSGKITWKTLEAVHKVEGRISRSTLSFTETEHIKRGNATLNNTYQINLAIPWTTKDEKIRGFWDSKSTKGGEVVVDLSPHLQTKE